MIRFCINVEATISANYLNVYYRISCPKPLNMKEKKQSRLVLMEHIEGDISYCKSLNLSLSVHNSFCTEK